MAIGTGAAILGSAAIGALAGGGNKGGSVQTQSSSEPWAGVQPHLLSLFNRSAAASYGQPSPYTLQSQQMAAQRALDPNSAIGRSQGVLNDTISGQYLDPQTNPYLKESVSDALGQAKAAFAGQYGGNAGSNLSNSGYQEGLARNLGSVATNAYANAYSQERQNQLNAMQLAPTLGNADIAQLAGVGTAQENQPWQNLQKYQQMISGSFGGQSTNQTPYFTNPLATAMGLGIGGLSLYNGANQAGLFGAPAQASSIPFYTGYGVGGDYQYG